LDELFTEAVNVFDEPVFMGADSPDTLTVTGGLAGVPLLLPPQPEKRAAQNRIAALDLWIIIEPLRIAD